MRDPDRDQSEVGGGGAGPAGPSDDLAALQRARTLQGRARARALSEWERALGQVPATAAEREARATAVRGALEGRDLDALVGFRGRTARSIAVQALLKLGFPHALEVHPDDLAYLRRLQAGGAHRAALVGLRGCLGLSLAGQGALAVAWGGGGISGALGDGGALATGVLAPLAAAAWVAWVRLGPWILHPHVRPVD